jgi:hypothetical protein
MNWIAFGIWVFGSVCFAAGAWWATRPKETELGEGELRPRASEAGQRRRS